MRVMTSTTASRARGFGSLFTESVKAEGSRLRPASLAESTCRLTESAKPRLVPETAFLTLTFRSGTTANVQVSWLAPRKVRSMVVVGSKRMIQYEDTASDEPIRIYDRGLDFSQPTNFGEYQLTYRSGEVVIPRIDAHEPLGLELADFAHSIRTGATPR